MKKTVWLFLVILLTSPSVALSSEASKSSVIRRTTYCQQLLEMAAWLRQRAVEEIDHDAESAVKTLNLNLISQSRSTDIQARLAGARQEGLTAQERREMFWDAALEDGIANKLKHVNEVLQELNRSDSLREDDFFSPGLNPWQDHPILGPLTKEEEDIHSLTAANETIKSWIEKIQKSPHPQRAAFDLVHRLTAAHFALAAFQLVSPEHMSGSFEMRIELLLASALLRLEDRAAIRAISFYLRSAHVTEGSIAAVQFLSAAENYSPGILLSESYGELVSSVAKLLVRSEPSILRPALWLILKVRTHGLWLRMLFLNGNERSRPHPLTFILGELETSLRQFKERYDHETHPDPFGPMIAALVKEISNWNGNINTEGFELAENVITGPLYLKDPYLTAHLTPLAMIAGEMLLLRSTRETFLFTTVLLDHNSSFPKLPSPLNQLEPSFWGDTFQAFPSTKLGLINSRYAEQIMTEKSGAVPKEMQGLWETLFYFYPNPD